MSADRESTTPSNKENKMADTLVSEVTEQDASHAKQLMELVDPWDSDEDVWFEEDEKALPQMSVEHPWERENEDDRYCPSPATSEDSIMTYASWMFNSDSDTSEVFTPDYQDVVEEISKVCQYYVYGENLEQEEDDDREDVLVTQTDLTSRLSMVPEESEEPAALSPSQVDVEESASRTSNMISTSLENATAEHLWDSDNKAVNCPSPAMSEDSIMTLVSWSSNSDSDITEVFTPDIHDEEIRKLWWYYVLAHRSEDQKDHNEASSESQLLAEPLEVRPTKADEESTQEKERIVPSKKEGEIPNDHQLVLTSSEEQWKEINEDQRQHSNETPPKGLKSKRKQSQWRGCFSGLWRNKILRHPQKDSPENTSTPSSKLDSTPQETSSSTQPVENMEEDYMTPHIISEQQTDTSHKKTVEATKEKTRSGFRRFFCNIFSKKDETKKTEQQKKTKASTKRLQLWKRLSFCGLSR